jgi:hypothetical protein
MDAKYSENIFRNYLNSHNFQYNENYVVGTAKNPKDVDFYIFTDAGEVYADVKEIRDSSKAKWHNDAYQHLREDIRELRKKFKDNRPSLPVVLISMNLSSNYFTGYAVAQAMLGDTGVEFNPFTNEITKPLHHLLKGNASLTKKKNRSISGILVFDLSGDRHCLFVNPYADHPIPMDFFPGVRMIHVDKNADGKDITRLSSIMFRNIKPENRIN